MGKKQKLSQSFINAYKGFIHCYRAERNLQIHIVVSILVLVAACYFQVRHVEWIALILCMALVIAAELMNSAIERLCDRVSREQDKDIAYVKDVSAAAVLVISLMAVLIGLLVFLPYLKSIMI